MKASILIPTRNRLNYLRQAIASAIAQTYTNLEIVVSDDGSVDGTSHYLAELMSRDARVRVAPANAEPGIFTNINHLIAHAAGQAFCVLGDDDLLAPTYVERLLAPLLADQTVCASFCDHDIIDAEGRILAFAGEQNSRAFGRTELQEGAVGDPLPKAMRGTMCMGFSMYRSSIFRHEKFDLACLGAADYDYAIRAVQRGTIYFVKDRLGSYRSHPGTTTGTRNEYMIDGIVAVYGKHRFSFPEHEALRRSLLLQRLRIKLVHASTSSPSRFREAMREYLSEGGSRANARVLAAILLSKLPTRVAEVVKEVLHLVAKAARRAIA